MVDIIIIVFIVLSAFIGYKKGFVSVIIKLTGFILAVLLAFAFKDSVAKFLDEQAGLGNTIRSTVEKSINNYVNAENNDKDKKEKSNFITDNKIFKDAFQEIENSKKSETQKLVSKLTNKITSFVLKGISFVLIIVLVMIIVGILGLILNTIAKLPVLKTFNGLAGAGIQVVIAILEISIILAIISFLSPLQMMSKVQEYINDSVISSWIYDNNLIVKIISTKLFKA